jgi:hypothetical protein
MQMPFDADSLCLGTPLLSAYRRVHGNVEMGEPCCRIDYWKLTLKM